MKRIRMFIKNHQLLSFFLLSYLITWLLSTPALLFGENQIFSILGLIGLFSPAYVNILISRSLSSSTEQGFKKQRLIFFLSSWVLAMLAFLLNATKGSRLESPIAVVIFALFALLPAFVIRAVHSKFNAVRKSLFSILHPQGSFIWYLFALIVPWVIKWVSLPITKQLGWAVLSDPDRVNGAANVLLLVTTSLLYELFFAGGLNEEVGWTGFALPRLQNRFSPVIASMLLWFFWILWHIPFQIGGYWNPELGDFIRSLIGSFFARFIFTWLFNKTRGGTLSAIIFHASANVSFMFLPATPVHMILEAVIAVAMIFIGRMWKKLPSDHPGVYQ